MRYLSLAAWLILMCLSAEPAFAVALAAAPAKILLADSANCEKFLQKSDPESVFVMPGTGTIAGFTLATWVKTQRKALGIRQAELARAAGEDQNFISRVESGAEPILDARLVAALPNIEAFFASKAGQAGRAAKTETAEPGWISDPYPAGRRSAQFFIHQGNDAYVVRLALTSIVPMNQLKSLDFEVRVREVGVPNGRVIYLSAVDELLKEIHLRLVPGRRYLLSLIPRGASDLDGRPLPALPAPERFTVQIPANSWLKAP